MLEAETRIKEIVSYSSSPGCLGAYCYRGYHLVFMRVSSLTSNKPEEQQAGFLGRLLPLVDQSSISIYGLAIVRLYNQSLSSHSSTNGT